jgi:hypothetical protein
MAPVRIVPDGEHENQRPSLGYCTSPVPLPSVFDQESHPAMHAQKIPSLTFLALSFIK